MSATDLALWLAYDEACAATDAALARLVEVTR